LFSRSRLGTRIVETGKELLVPKSSRSSLDTSSSPSAAKSTTNSPSLLRRLSGRRRESSDASSAARESAEWAQPDKDVGDKPLQPSTTPLAGRDMIFQDSQTPNRSFAWQADADFTAGDLQFSNSPPVAVGRSNTKIDEIRALEAEINGRFPETSDDQPEDARLDNIRSLETRVALNLIDGALGSEKAHTAIHEARPDDEFDVSSPRPVSQASMRMDELRFLEMESLSRRALATARLGELRKTDGQTSRSPSPDVVRKSSRDLLRAFSPLRDRLRRPGGETPAITAQAENDQAGQGAPAPSTLTHGHSPSNTANAGPNGRVGEGEQRQRRLSLTKEDSSDILRRLAAAKSSSPTSQAQVAEDTQASAAREREPTERSRQRRSIGGAKSGIRPTVGFTGLSRSSSVESRLAKRTSFAQSDSDPTERIEGEMKLFAPQENQSEKGSLRALSPEPEEEAPEETPKPTKIDPLTQPSPRVTGAFVETPATVKVEKSEIPVAIQATEVGSEPDITVVRRLSTDSSEDFKPLPAQSGKVGVAQRQQKRTRSSTGDRAHGRPSSLSARRRARSLSRSRAPLINTARPPTVRDDLLEIHHANQIDDSTLDDIADLLNPQPQPRAALGSRGVKFETGANEKLDRDEELKAYQRLSRSLETGLAGIRSAKRGIEVLENKVAHADIKEHSQRSAPGDGAKGESPPCPACHDSQPPADAAVTYIRLPLPRLWYRRPKFRFTLLGLALFLLSLWYLAESFMCFWYCKPEYCYPGMPCDWSSDDPVWGYAIPVKLDQWITGGQGRELAHRLRPEVADWLADMRDAATGTDITTVDTSRYSWGQKRQHRRRLAKKGLAKPFVESPENRAMFNGWKSVREAKERAQSAQEMGYEVEEDESIASDERL
jgi:hypothetical protein